MKKDIKFIFKFLLKNAIIFVYPPKLLKTFFYHSYLYRVINKQFNGLHLGSGSGKIQDFYNIDANPFSDCDIISGIEKLKINSNTVGIIYSSHVFEHIPRRRIKKVMAEWHRVLKPGGRLYICVPDVEVLFRIYLDNLPKYQTEEGRYVVDMANGIVFGGQTNKFDFHHNGYSFITLKKFLEDTGFKNIKRFNHSNLSFHNITDAGNSAVIESIPISLNIECNK